MQMAIIRPWRLDDVIKACSKLGVRAMTVSEVKGMGTQRGKEYEGFERYQGKEYGDRELVTKTRVEITVSREQVDYVVNTIVTAVHTGEIGDGKIFIQPVAEIVRIRTGETGIAAERMGGGMQDMMATFEEQMLMNSIPVPTLAIPLPTGETRVIDEDDTPRS